MIVSPHLPSAIEHLATDTLVPYARNSRTHSPDQVQQIAASIREFGFTNPVLIDEDNTIIAGHGRVMASQQLGLAQVPCIRLSHLSSTQRRAYVIADNKLAENAGWDMATLAREMEDLAAESFDLQLLGFDDGALDEFLRGDHSPQTTRGADEDDAPDVETTASSVTSRGDIWVLGDHRLMCGDSTETPDVASLMSGRRAVLMQTDPPYGVNYVATKAGIPVSGLNDIDKRHAHIKNDDLQDEKLQSFLEGCFRAAVDAAIAPKCAWYLWHPMLTQGTFFAAAAAAGVRMHRQIIWVKPSFVLTRSGMYHWKHELCFYGWVPGNQPPWYGEKNQSSVWEVGRDRDAIHPTQKPVALWEPPLLNHTKRGELLYEPFAGSGGQIIAAEKHGRHCYAMELSEHYCDAIVKRWQTYTGRDAVLESSGQTFAQLASAGNTTTVE